MRAVTGQQQNIYDIAIQEYGAAEGVFALMADNPNSIADLNTRLIPGTKLKILSEPVNADVLKYLKAKNILPASGEVNDEGDAVSGLLNIDGTPLLNIDLTPLENVT